MEAVQTRRVPERSQQQRDEALVKANRVRVYRSALKRDLKHGRANVVEIILAPSVDVETMKVYDLLTAIPKFGRVKALRTLNVVRISSSKTVGGMSDRQRGELAHLLRGEG